MPELLAHRGNVLLWQLFNMNRLNCFQLGTFVERPLVAPKGSLVFLSLFLEAVSISMPSVYFLLQIDI